MSCRPRGAPCRMSQPSQKRKVQSFVFPDPKFKNHTLNTLLTRLRFVSQASGKRSYSFFLPDRVGNMTDYELPPEGFGRVLSTSPNRDNGIFPYGLSGGSPAYHSPLPPPPRGGGGMNRLIHSSAQKENCLCVLAATSCLRCKCAQKIRGVQIRRVVQRNAIQDTSGAASAAEGKRRATRSH